MSTHPDAPRRLLERMVTFSDGVMAIAITLLVLNLAVPVLTDGESLASGLADIRPQAFAWILSFAVIALLWNFHHRALDRLWGADRLLVAINFTFLALISMLPFTSDLFGQYTGDGLATAIYAANIAMLGLSLTAVQAVGDNRGFRREDAPPLNLLAGIVPMSFFAISIPVAFVDPTVAQAIWALSAIADPTERLLRRTVPGLTSGPLE